MVAKRYTLRPYWRSTMEAEEGANLDPRDEDTLRNTLERMVEARRGALKLDLSQWSLVVHPLGGGMIQSKLKVLPSGASQLMR